jgi:hypothetical protein
MSTKGKSHFEGTHLFFGTSEEVAKRSPVIGIQPDDVISVRPKGLSRNRVNRKKDCLYLTNVYAAYFALCNTGPGERWGLVEIDFAALDRTALLPDDDYLRQLHRAGLDADARMDGSRFHGSPPRWQDSLAHFGTCVYKGPILPAFITRVAIYDPLSNPFITQEVSQLIPSIAGHHSAADRCRALTRWLMGENITWQDWMAEELPDDSEERNRISAGLQERSGLDIFYYGPVPKKVVRTRCPATSAPKSANVLAKHS